MPGCVVSFFCSSLRSFAGDLIIKSRETQWTVVCNALLSSEALLKAKAPDVPTYVKSSDVCRDVMS